MQSYRVFLHLSRLPVAGNKAYSALTSPTIFNASVQLITMMIKSSKISLLSSQTVLAHLHFSQLVS